MVVMNHELINVGLLIAENTKYMVDVPQRVYENFCLINELCKLAGVQSHPDGEMVTPMLPINRSAMRWIQTHPIYEGGQEEEEEEEEKNQLYHLEIQQP